MVSKNGPRDGFHRKMKAFTPLFAMVSYQDYYDKSISDDLLFSNVKIFNGEVKNGSVFPPSNGHIPYHNSNFERFIEQNAIIHPDIKEPYCL